MDLSEFCDLTKAALRDNGSPTGFVFSGDLINIILLEAEITIPMFMAQNPSPVTFSMILHPTADKEKER